MSIELLVEICKLENIKEVDRYVNWKNYVNTFFCKEHYRLYMPGKIEIPVLLVAHFDYWTKFKDDIDSGISVDKQAGTIFGYCHGDDRCGVYICMMLAQKYGAPILITNGEESGGTGARAFCDGYKKLLKLEGFRDIMKEVKFMVEFDRRNGKDCVFYDCGNDDFVKYIESWGFEKEAGSFSDISILMNHFKVCGVNLSCGYYNCHSEFELIRYEEVAHTIKRFDDNIESCRDKEFKWKERKWGNSGWLNGRWTDEDSVGGSADEYNNYAKKCRALNSRKYDHYESSGKACEWCNEVTPLYNDSVYGMVCDNCLREQYWQEYNGYDDYAGLRDAHDESKCCYCKGKLKDNDISVFTSGMEKCHVKCWEDNLKSKEVKANA